METLDNRQYFPSFAELPMADEYLDPMYFAETADGHVVPTKTWCFFAEVIDNSLSQLPEFFHRVEVRDINGETTSILFTPDSHSFPYHTLSNGCTVFVRYASKCYFSDLMTQVLKVDDMDFVKVIQQPLDTLLTFSTFYYGSGSACLVCGTDVSSSSSRCLCNRCDVARYCSPGCMQQHSGEHGQHCGVCQQLSAVLNVDFDRFVEAVPFRPLVGLRINSTLPRALPEGAGIGGIISYADLPIGLLIHIFRHDTGAQRAARPCCKAWRAACNSCVTRVTLPWSDISLLTSCCQKLDVLRCAWVLKSGWMPSQLDRNYSALTHLTLGKPMPLLSSPAAAAAPAPAADPFSIPSLSDPCLHKGEGLMSCVQALPSLKNLALHCCEDVGEGLGLGLNGFRHGSNQGNHAGTEYPWLTNLQQIEFSKCPLIDIGQSAAESLAVCTRLSFNCCYLVLGMGSLVGLTALKELELSHCAFRCYMPLYRRALRMQQPAAAAGSTAAASTAAAAAAAARALPAGPAPQLTRLVLNDVRPAAGDGYFKQLGDILDSLPLLVVLEVRDNSDPYLLEAICGCRHLTELDLRGTYMPWTLQPADVPHRGGLQQLQLVRVGVPAAFVPWMSAETLPAAVQASWVHLLRPPDQVAWEFDGEYQALHAPHQGVWFPAAFGGPEEEEEEEEEGRGGRGVGGGGVGRSRC